jgi:hypothetical protein
MMRLQLVVTIGVAIAVIAAGLLLGQWLGPFYGMSRFDPAYAYLFNGLGLLQGWMPGHTDHPGTTIQELAAVTILFRWLITLLAGSRQSVADSVLSQPEVYLAAINFVLLALGAAATVLGVLFLMRRTGRIWPALLALALMICSPNLMESLTDVKPEPLLIALATLVVLLASSPIQLHRKQARFVRPMLLGGVLGAGIVTKITFAPLALFVLALPGIIDVGVAGFAAAVATALFTIPIWPELGAMLSWHLKVLTHQGQYGEGPPGLPPAASLLDGAWSLLYGAEPIFFVAIAVLGIAVVLPVRDRGSEPGSWRLFLIGFVIILSQLAVTTPRPAAHYLVPSLGVIVMLVPLAAHFLIKRTDRAGMLAAAAGVLVTLGLLAWSGIGTMLVDIANGQRAAVELQQLTEVANDANCRLLPYYRFGARRYAMLFGNDFSRRAYAEGLDRLYPGYVTFNIWAECIEGFAGCRDDAFVSRLIAAGRPVCLLGSVKLDMLHMHKTEATLLARNGSFFLYGLQGLR